MKTEKTMIKTSDNLAIIYKEERYSYKELLLHTAIYSQQIAPFNQKKAIIFAENCPQWIFAFFAIWHNNAIVIPVDAMSQTEELTYILNDSEADIIFCSKATQEIANKAVTAAKTSPRVILFDNIPDISSDINTPPIEEINASDIEAPAFIIYTSGTTGEPKGAMLSYKNIIKNIFEVSKSIPIFRDDDRVILLLPLHHIFPLMGSLLATMMVGCTAVICPSLNPNDIRSTFIDHKINIIIAVPRFYEMIRNGIMKKINSKAITRLLFSLARKVNNRKFSRFIFAKVHNAMGGELRHLVCGGAALDQNIGQDYWTLGFDLLEGYGMTETAPMISFTRPGEWVSGSAGKILDGVSVRIENDEIVVKGDNVMLGYYNRPKETAATIKDGWLYTGDLGRVDSENRIFITGRKKEIIILSNGKNINPTFIEQELIEKIEGFQDIALTLFDDKLHLLIVPDLVTLEKLQISDHHAYFREQLHDNYNQQVAPFKNILRFTIIDQEIPRTRLGKIKRFQLNHIIDKTAFEKEKSDDNSPSFSELDMLITFLSQLKSTSVTPVSLLSFDLALDSLDKIELQAFIDNSFGIFLKAHTIMQFNTPLALAEYIRDNKQKMAESSIDWNQILKDTPETKMPKSSWFSFAILKILKGFFHLLFRFKHSGTENIPEGPVIFAPNHQSFLDAFMISSLLTKSQYKNTVYYAKKQHFTNKLKLYIAQHNNIIVVDIDKNLRNSILQLATALKQKKNIIIFPEGTRSLDGNLNEFKDMFAILSAELNVPVLPISIDGAFNALPKGKKFPKLFTRIVIDFLPAISPKDRDFRTIKEETLQEIKKSLKSKKSN